MITREGICFKLYKTRENKNEKIEIFPYLFLQLEQIGIPVSTVTSTFDE